MYNEPLNGIPLYRADQQGNATHVYMYALWMNSKRWVTEDNRKEGKEKKKNSSECMCDAIPDSAWYGEHPYKPRTWPYYPRSWNHTQSMRPSASDSCADVLLLFGPFLKLFAFHNRDRCCFSDEVGWGNPGNNFSTQLDAHLQHSSIAKNVLRVQFITSPINL